MNSGASQSGWWVQASCPALCLCWPLFTLTVRLSDHSFPGVFSHAPDPYSVETRRTRPTAQLRRTFPLSARLPPLRLSVLVSPGRAWPDSVPLLSSGSARLHLGSPFLSDGKLSWDRQPAATTGLTPFVPLLLRARHPSPPDVQCHKNPCSICLAFSLAARVGGSIHSL